MRLLALSFALASLLACGPNAGAGDDSDMPGNDDGDNTPEDPGTGNAAVFAHSAQQLYRIDPATLEVTLVGDFDWPSFFGDEMTDIAIDRDGQITGVSYTRVYSVDPATAECTGLGSLGGREFNGLSWVPSGSGEILVGADKTGEVVEIDPITGNTNRIGAYEGGWGSSGDIVAVRGLGILATVTDGDGGDLLARIDPATWQATIIGDTGVDNIWGLGFWGSQLYGFTDTRRFVLIDPATGATSPVESGEIRWWGAGVTTAAPVVE